MPIQNCPLCKKHDASVKGINSGKQNEFECPHCKTFIVDMDVEKNLAELKPSQIKKLSTDSLNCPAGHVYYIHKPSKDSLQGHCVPGSNSQ